MAVGIPNQNNYHLCPQEHRSQTETGMEHPQKDLIGRREARGSSTSQQSVSSIHSFSPFDTISTISNAAAHPSPVYSNHYVTLRYITYKIFPAVCPYNSYDFPINIYYFPQHYPTQTHSVFYMFLA